MVSAAQKRVQQSQAEVRAARAAVVSRQKAADAAKRGIAKERAGVAQARAGYQSAAAQKGYAALRAEVDAVITARPISPGTLVNPGQTVMKVAQISPIRLQANVPLADLYRVRIGTSATVSVGEQAGVAARVTSVAPALDPKSRTGVVEVIWPNLDRKFLPGQFVSMRIQVGTQQPGPAVPSEAVQRQAGGKTFVWVAEPTADEGRYTVRRTEVEVGSSDGRRVAVASGLRGGEKVLVSGGAYLRDGSEVAVESARPDGSTVEVLSSGYRPSVVEIPAGRPATLTFIRKTESTCGEEVVFPSLGIKKKLPMGTPVKVQVPAQKPGQIDFTCGMKMLQGKVVVR
jgi:RND family efflux transporter MFP subunit